jgi:leukotriene-A4 hydrolase
MLSVLSVQDLQKEVRELGPTNSDTQLKTDFTGRDPEDTATQIPYEKGQFFLRTIEQAVGRPRFDAFLKGYFDHFAFQSITTEDFLDYLREHLIRGDKTLEESLRIQDWVYKPGLPSNMVKVRSTALEKVDEQMREWVEGKSLNAVDTSKWTTQHWMHFIRMIPENAGADKMKELDSAFHFSHSQNAEILHEWLLQVIARQYKPAYSAIERLLEMSGRRKYVKSIFTALIRTPDGLRFARGFYGKLRPRYHAVTRDIGDRLLQWNEK